MKFIEKLAKRNNNMLEEKPVTIAFLGDSVTQGCFELYMEGENGFNTVFEPQNSYVENVKRILQYLFPMAQINVINAGISGGNTDSALKRIDRDVIKFLPDLTVVCLGTNDCTAGIDGLQEYLDNLKSIFEKLNNVGTEIVFLTPHTINDHVSKKIQSKVLIDLAEQFAKNNSEGVVDCYYDNAKRVCKEYNVKVCDCYSIWKNLNKKGVNTTELLCNQLNHPSREMHWLFAHELVKTFFED